MLHFLHFIVDNSAGGEVLMITHMFDKFEGHAALDTFAENFKLYGAVGDIHDHCAITHALGNNRITQSIEHPNITKPNHIELAIRENVSLY